MSLSHTDHLATLPHQETEYDLACPLGLGNPMGQGQLQLFRIWWFSELGVHTEVGNQNRG